MKFRKMNLICIAVISLLVFCIGFAALAHADPITSGDWKYVTKEADGQTYAVIKDYLGSGTDLVIPSKVDSYEVREIGEYAFSEETKYTSLTIPDSVTKIGDCAFRNCSNIKIITIGKNVKEIGMYAFSSTAISTIVFPDSVTTMGESILGGCTSLKSIELSKNITSIPVYFANGTAIPEIKIPEGVTTICGSAFFECRYLERVDLPSTLQYIYASAFEGNTKLKTIWLPEGLNTIRQQAFRKCTSLEVITLPASLRTIEHEAFIGCNNLKTVIAKATEGYYNYSQYIGYDSSKNLIDGVIIYCVPGSPIANYADENGITRKDLTSAPKDPSEGFHIDDGDDISPAPVTKKANTLSVKAKRTYTVKFKALKKKNQTIKISKLVTFKNKGQGTLTYSRAKGNKKITVNKKTGKITLKKGLKKATYKVTIAIKAAGNGTYNAATKNVTVKIKVK